MVAAAGLICVNAVPRVAIHTRRRMTTETITMQAADLDKLRTETQQLVERLKTERDELKVHTHLARAEVREEWDKLERHWHELEHKARQLGATASASAKDIGVAVHLLGDELGRAYQRLRRTLDT